MIKAVLFDMDGVLIDSVMPAFRTRKKLLASYGVDLDALPDPQGEGHRAASIKILLNTVKEYLGIDIDYDEFAKKAIYHLHKNLQGIVVDPGLVIFLEELKRRNIICAVVSSGQRVGVIAKLQALGIENYFKTVVTGNDVKDHKPHPEIYQYTIEKIKIAPQNCIAIEDSSTGVSAALGSGCRVIGFVQFNSDKKHLPGTAMTVKSWSQINFDIVERLVTD